MARIRTDAAPISWLHVAGFVLVLWAVSSETFAQAREVVVTEVRGTAVRSSSAPLRSLDALKPGDRFRISTDSQVTLFTADDARLYEISGPAEVSLSPNGPLANGKPVEARKVADAYRNVKVGGPEMVQGSMAMRSAGGPRLRGPEGVVSDAAGRSYSWTITSPVRFELATQAGDTVYRSAASGGALTLPADIRLVPGERYVWGIYAEGNAAVPLDWTEFSVVRSDSPSPVAPGSTSERVLHAAWLNSQGLERAALRTLQPGRD